MVGRELDFHKFSAYGARRGLSSGGQQNAAGNGRERDGKSVDRGVLYEAVNVIDSAGAIGWAPAGCECADAGERGDDTQPCLRDRSADVYREYNHGCKAVTVNFGMISDRVVRALQRRSTVPRRSRLVPWRCRPALIKDRQAGLIPDKSWISPGFGSPPLVMPVAPSQSRGQRLRRFLPCAGGTGRRRLRRRPEIRRLRSHQ